MTIKELYLWAVKNKCEKFNVRVWYGTYNGILDSVELTNEGFEIRNDEHTVYI